MKKNQFLLTTLLIASICSLTFANAAEIAENTAQETAETTDIDITSEEENIITDISEETVNTSDSTTNEETSEELSSDSDIVNNTNLNETNIIEETDTKTTKEGAVEKNSTPDQAKTTQGWVNIIALINNTTFKEETKITFVFKNVDTEETITKELSSINNFEASIKLPLGTYTVSLEDEYFENFIIYEKELIVDKDIQNYNININSYVPATEDIEEKPISKAEVFWGILKNNLLFLLIILGCGGYLLFKEIKRRTSD